MLPCDKRRQVHRMLLGPVLLLAPLGLCKCASIAVKPHLRRHDRLKRGKPLLLGAACVSCGGKRWGAGGRAGVFQVQAFPVLGSKDTVALVTAQACVPPGSQTPACVKRGNGVPACSEAAPVSAKT